MLMKPVSFGGGGDSSSTKVYLLARQQDAIILLLEPFHGLILGDPMTGPYTTLPSTLVAHAVTGPTEYDVEVHSVDTDARVVLDTQVDVFLDAEAKVACVGKISLSQLVFTYLQASFQDLFSLCTSDRAVTSDLLVSPDAERANGVPSFGKDRCLSGQLLQDF